MPGVCCWSPIYSALFFLMAPRALRGRTEQKELRSWLFSEDVGSDGLCLGHKEPTGCSVLGYGKLVIRTICSLKEGP